MAHLAGIESRHVNSRTALCGYPQDRARRVESKKNGPVAVPGSSDWHRRSCQCADQATIEIEPLEQPVRIKRNGMAIRRPKRKRRTAGPSQRAC